MNKTIDRNKIKKQNNFLIYFSIFVLVSLIVSAILILLTPAKEEVLESEFVVKNYDQSETEFGQVNFTGEKIIVPERISVYRPKNNYQTAAQLAQKLINKYQLQQKENLETHWINGQYTLIERFADEEYVFYDFSQEEAVSSNENIFDTEFNLESGIRVCQNFLKENDININLSAQNEFISYIGGGLEPRPTDIDQASLAIIPFSIDINGEKVFYQNEDQFPFYCTVDRQQNIHDFVFKDLFFEFEEVKELDTISIDRAISNIKAGKASIIDASSQIAEIFDLFYIKEANLYQVELEYRYDENLAIAYPFYHFKAKITNSEGLNLESDIITPAVNTAAE